MITESREFRPERRSENKGVNAGRTWFRDEMGRIICGCDVGDPCPTDIGCHIPATRLQITQAFPEAWVEPPPLPHKPGHTPYPVLAAYRAHIRAGRKYRGTSWEIDLGD